MCVSLLADLRKSDFYTKSNKLMELIIASGTKCLSIVVTVVQEQEYYSSVTNSSLHSCMALI